MKKLIIILLISLIISAGLINRVGAQTSTTTDPNPPNCTAKPNAPSCQSNSPNRGECEKEGNTELCNPIGVSDVSSIVAKIIRIFLGILGALSLVMFIYGGFLMLASAGKADSIKKGQQTLIWAALGILVVFASYVILKFFFEVVGI